MAKRELPIIFSGAMVRAVMTDWKHETRRLLRPQPVCPPGFTRLYEERPQHSFGAAHGTEPEGCYLDRYHLGPQWNFWTIDGRVMNDAPMWQCPYGAAGDYARLWVREAWRMRPDGTIAFRADDAGALELGGSWQSPLFLPRHHSRLVLDVEDVAVRRLQAMTEVDALDEGVMSTGRDYWTDEERGAWLRWDANGGGLVGPPPLGPSPLTRFGRLWDSLHAARGTRWHDNPWVWVVRFRKWTP
jgi:hypothetical protein